VGEESTTLTFTLQGHNHESMVSAILLSRKLAGSPSGEYVFKGIDWKKEEGGDPEAQALSLTIQDAATVTIAGKELKVRELRGVKSGDPDATVFRVGADGRFISFASTTNPVQVVASDLVESTAAPEATTPGTDTPKAAAALYLQVLAGGATIEDLNRVMDWPTLHQESGAENANIAALDVDTFRTLMLAEFRKQVGVINQEQLALIIPMLKVKEDGDTATVTIPGQEKSPFHLRKTATGWVITKFPR
jgi:hypothetical protein